MNAREAFRKFEDEYGLIQPRVGASGNGICYTAEAYIIMSDLGLVDADAKARAHKAISSCELVPGLFQRHPKHFTQDQEGPDDYHGIAAISAVLGLPLAERALEYGRKNHFVYMNVPFRFTLNAWLGRQPQLPYLLGDKEFWRKLVLIASLCRSLLHKRHEHDGWRLSWLAIRATQNRSWFIRMFAKHVWSKALYRRFPGGLRELYTDYLQDAEHPLAIYSEGILL